MATGFKYSPKSQAEQFNIPVQRFHVGFALCGDNGTIQGDAFQSATRDSVKINAPITCMMSHGRTGLFQIELEFLTPESRQK